MVTSTIPPRRAVELALPFTGRWLTQNSPARRVPSHGVDLWGETYAIDFVGVDDRGRTAVGSDWRTALATEPPERFVSFGRAILAPADGVVVDAHDGEPDHRARRSQAALLPYALGQAKRVRRGVAAVAGNRLTIALAGDTGFVALAHLREGSLRVRVGATVTTGQWLADCGNSGNSTQPHLHLQVTDDPDWTVARGIPVLFRRYREWAGRSAAPAMRASGVPGEGAVVEPLPSPGAPLFS